LTNDVDSKLLLRIYGPQAAHLIDRDTELYILRRLARQKIGPRLLGTFENGRFEEFLSARTLTKADVRVPDTSRHIAKRLKELHEGIDLEPQERQQGPIAWKNWEKWIPRCRQVMATIDTRSNISATSLICGARWEIFEAAVERYRQWLLVTKYSNNASLLSSSLVFAHNDTQYGNILRLQIPTPTPDMTTPAQKPSPLLHLSNQHRQLVVIDFEYASANTPGFEFANHFCEWMADYHDASRPHFMNTAHFPSKGEMYNFLAAYVGHSLKKHLSGGPGAFSLDSRAQPPADEVQHLLDETVAWMPASSVMWCAWGIVQAKEDVKEGEFDYLLYAQQRALMFWGDCLFLGVFTEGELEEWQPGLVEKCKSGIGEWRK
jgi:choline kinase